MGEFTQSINFEIVRPLHGRFQVQEK